MYGGPWTTMGQNQAIWANGWCCVQRIILVPFTSLRRRLCYPFHKRAAILEVYNLAIEIGFRQTLDIQDKTSASKWFLRNHILRRGEGVDWVLLFQMSVWVSETQNTAQTWKGAFCKLLVCKEKSNLWKAGQTMLTVTGLAQNIFILPHGLSRIFKVRACAMNDSLSLLW